MASPRLLFILAAIAAVVYGDNVSIQYVIIHTTSNATSSSSSSVASNANYSVSNNTPSAEVVTGNRVADASIKDEASVAPPSEGTMYYNSARGSEHVFSVSYDHQIPGLPGKDYPIYSHIPPTTFDCSNSQTGYFADENSGCQVIHICQEDGTLESFLCPNGTIFNQQYLVCDWWFNVDCSKSKDFYYSVNVDSRQASSPPRDQEVSASVQDHTAIYADSADSSIEEYAEDEDLDENGSHEKNTRR